MVRAGVLLTVTLGAGVAEWVSVGPDGAVVPSLAIDRRRPAVLYCIPTEFPDTPQVFRTTDAGAHWDSVGRFCDYYASSLAVDPFQSSIIYAASGVEAAYRSTDCGVTWGVLHLPARASVLAPDPAIEGRLYAVGYLAGAEFLPAVSVSTDRGETWSCRIPDSSAFRRYGLCIGIDPARAGVLYVGCSDSLVYRSADGGLTWEPRNAGLPGGVAVRALAASPADPSLVLAGTDSLLFRSADTGRMWQPIANVRDILSVQFSPDPAVAYALSNNPQPQLVVSVDSGATWNPPPSGVKHRVGSMMLADPVQTDVAYVYGPVGIVRTADRGTTFAPAHGGIRLGRAATLSASPLDGRRLYVEMADNGVFASRSGGDSWSPAGYFIDCGVVCGIGVGSELGRDVLYALEGHG